jgi:hypothetical protein
MYSRKAIETAMYFGAGQSERFSLYGLQFRADGSIEATDGHQAVIVPPQFDLKEWGGCPKPHKKSRVDIFVPRDVLGEMLRRTKGKGKRAAEETWYGVETTKAGGVFFSWGMVAEQMEFKYDAKFPKIERVFTAPAEAAFTVSLGAEAVATLMAAIKYNAGSHYEACATFEFHGPDTPINWRMGDLFGVLMPFRADSPEPHEFEQKYREQARANTPTAEKPVVKDKQAEPETGEESDTPYADAADAAHESASAADITRAQTPDPEPAPKPDDGMMVVTVKYSDVYDVSPNGREYSEDTGCFRDHEEMDPEEVADLIRNADTYPALEPFRRLIYRGEEDMFGHTMTKTMTITYTDGTPIDQKDWAWLLEEASKPIDKNGWYYEYLVESGLTDMPARKAA